MNHKILFLLLLTFNISFAQKVKKMKKNVGHGKAIYYVLKSDTNIKHGKYIVKTYTGRDIVVSGNYVNGNKDGQWIEKHIYKGRKLKSQGNYKDNKRVGDWIFYNTKGDSIQIYNFDEKKLKWTKSCKSDRKYNIHVEGKITETELDCKPMFLGGIDTFFNGFRKYFIFKYPADKSEIIEFDNTILLTLEKDNTLSNIQFEKDVPNKKFKDILTEYIIQKKENWLTGKKNNDNVKVLLDLKFKFKFRIN